MCICLYACLHIHSHTHIQTQVTPLFSVADIGSSVEVMAGKATNHAHMHTSAPRARAHARARARAHTHARARTEACVQVEAMGAFVPVQWKPALQCSAFPAQECFAVPHADGVYTIAGDHTQ